MIGLKSHLFHENLNFIRPIRNGALVVSFTSWSSQKKLIFTTLQQSPETKRPSSTISVTFQELSTGILKTALSSMLTRSRKTWWLHFKLMKVCLTFSLNQEHYLLLMQDQTRWHYILLKGTQEELF